MSLISSLQGLDRLPDGILDTGLDFAMVESPAEIRFLNLHDAAERELARGFPAGCAFGETRELRWVRRVSGYHLVLIRDDDQPLDQARDSQHLEPDGEDKILLWGRKQGAEFLEGRIPRPLPYPGGAEAGEQGRLAVAIRYYTLPEEGVRLFRCVELVPA